MRRSWRAVDSAALVERFYARLFAADPGVEALFLDDPAARRRKFDDTLTALVEHLDDPTEVGSRVRALGARHAGYGVQPRHYALVETALIAAFGDALGERFDVRTERAWRLLYRALADAMLDGDAEAALSEPR